MTSLFETSFDHTMSIMVRHKPGGWRGSLELEWISWDIYFGNNLGKFEKMQIQTWRLTASFGTLLHSASWSSVCSKLGLCPAAKLCTLSLDVNFYLKISCILHFCCCNFELVFWKFEEITYGLMMSTGHCPAKLQTLWTKCSLGVIVDFKCFLFQKTIVIFYIVYTQQ